MANILKSLGITKSEWIADNITPAQNVSDTDIYSYGEGYSTVASLLGNAENQARSRQQIYQKWAEMESTPICATAAKILVTTALGGHENTGQAVFLEKSPICQKNKQLEKIADEIISDLTKPINDVIFTASYRGAIYGDSYARVYGEKGVEDVYTDEMYHPSLIIPFQRGSKTIGFMVNSGQKQMERLTVEQMVRFEMPRSQWIPQQSVIQKSFKIDIGEDNRSKLPITMSMVGGSLLYAAEPAYNQLMSSLASLNAQRIRDALDEAYLTVDMESMTKDQQKRTVESIKNMLTNTKTLVDDAIKNNKPFNSILRHILPVNGQKQITNITPLTSARSNTISIEDVMFSARLLSATIGVDLSMIGFSDQLTGMFGDGGMGRVNAMTTEQSRNVRIAARKFCQDIIDIHTMKKYGVVFTGENCPVQINFYGSILAYEAEKQAANVAAAAAAITLIQGIQMFKDIGANKDQMNTMLTKQFMLDEAEAEIYAPIVDAKPPEGAEGGTGFGGEADNENDIKPLQFQQQQDDEE